MFRSLRSRIILASVLWTMGLLGLMHMASLLLLRVMPSLRGISHVVPLAIGLGLMASGFLLARGSLSPFRQLKIRLGEVRNGTSARVEGEFPREVEPLVAELNALLHEREQALQRARATAGDLAHGLKTPLALLTQEAEQAQRSGNTGIAHSLQWQIERMTRLVDYHLARASAAASSAHAIPPCGVAEAGSALLRTLGKLHAARAARLECLVEDSLRVRVRREDLDEMLGNLLDNACKWTRSRIVLSAEFAGGSLDVLVDDDGPGLPVESRQRVLERGIRADEKTPGAGLGLGIVRELAEIYGGRIRLEDSPLGGLRARLTLPAYSGNRTSSPGFKPSAI